MKGYTLYHAIGSTAQERRDAPLVKALGTSRTSWIGIKASDQIRNLSANSRTQKDDKELFSGLAPSSTSSGMLLQRTLISTPVQNIEWSHRKSHAPQTL